MRNILFINIIHSVDFKDRRRSSFMFLAIDTVRHYVKINSFGMMYVDS